MKRFLLAVMTLAAIAGCSSAESAQPTDENDVAVSEDQLSASQKSLANLAWAQVSSAAEKYQGEPNILVELSPSASSRLEFLSLPDNTNATLREALLDAGASNLGAARIAGTFEKIHFRGHMPTKVIYLLRSTTNKNHAVGIVFHTIDRIDECSFGRVSAFSLDGTRVFNKYVPYCS